MSEPEQSPVHLMDRITTQPDVMGGKPTIHGLRMTVGTIIGLLAAGHSIVHLQETFSDVVKTDKTGLSKTAHTRWMISAFANFLPGSTIFRLA